MVKNWRPIILLNLDYKIISKTIANRIKSLLNDLIAQEQTGFMKGRNISENLRKLLDVMHIAEDQNIPLLLIQVDFEKAFDRVEYSSLFKTLR